MVKRAAQLAGVDDELVTVRPVVGRANSFSELIGGDGDAPAFAPLKGDSARVSLNMTPPV